MRMVQLIIKRLAAGLAIGAVAVAIGAVAVAIFLPGSNTGTAETKAWGMITSQPNTTEGKV
jgi:hypothetical protein